MVLKIIRMTGIGGDIIDIWDQGYFVPSTGII